MSRNTWAAMLIAAVAGTGTMAAAGTCPPDQVLTEPRDIEQIAAVALRREVLANVRLEGWRDMGGFLLRMRRLEVQPGGFVPTHSHADRPAIVYTVIGTVIEHNTFCAVPITHHAGDVSEEFGPGYEHWWENKGSETVVFISADVLPYNSDAPPYVGIEK
jgi:quercetin dioxygenase-like cupin family protein